MNTDERDRLIAEKLDEGVSLSDIQKLLANEHDLNITYLDLRLIAADLDVDWQKQDAKRAKPKPAVDTDLSNTQVSDSGTSITVNKVVRPGASMSGDVEFASGAKAEWFVDAMGRLGLNPAPGSSKPTESDLQEFQLEARQVVFQQDHQFLQYFHPIP